MDLVNLAVGGMHVRKAYTLRKNSRPLICGSHRTLRGGQTPSQLFGIRQCRENRQRHGRTSRVLVK